MSISGNILQTNGNMYINNGSLIVGGDYRIQTKSTDTSNNSVSYSYSDGCLKMQKEEKVILNQDGSKIALKYIICNEYFEKFNYFRTFFAYWYGRSWYDIKKFNMITIYLGTN